jgi:AcrR family transcriptional regulator
MKPSASMQDGPRRPKSPRARDAAASRQALLESAQALFGRNGYERTTTRDIGELAGVDAALIARYFGRKADLYIAAVVEEDQSGAQRPRELTDLRAMVDELLTRAERGGPGPILQAIVRYDTSDDIREAAITRLAQRLVDPLVPSMNDRPRLRAEITVAALIGISLGRSLGWFDTLRSVPRNQLVNLITETLGPELGDNPSGQKA